MTVLEQQKTVAESDTFRTAVSVESETAPAIDELLDELAADSAELTVVFVSPDHDLDVVSRHLDRRTGPNGIAATTAGELSLDRGFTQGTITGVSFGGDGVRATAEIIPNLDELSLVPVEQLPEQFARRIGRERDELSLERHLWLLLTDGISGAEDLLTPFFVRQAPPTRLVGGSLGDSDRSGGARLAFHGRRYTNAAALALLEYDPPFELFHHQHMEFLEPTLEVTEVAERGRVIEKLDDRRAAERYTRALGVDPERADPQFCAEHPLGFQFRGKPLVYSVTKIMSGGRLRMAKSVQPGDELRILEPTDLVASTAEKLSETLEAFQETHGRPARGALFFHCLGRYLEAEASDEVEALASALGQLAHAGLNTYGEQYREMHTNHTLTGALFG